MALGSTSMARGRDLSGVVMPGRGLGQERLAHSDTLARLQELLGFPVIPGTLNLRLPNPLERNLFSRYVPAAEIGAGWEADTGQAGYFLAPILVADRFRGAAFQADEPGYPPDQVELLCEVHLRRTLGLRDGDRVAFSVLTSE